MLFLFTISFSQVSTVVFENKTVVGFLDFSVNGQRYACGNSREQKFFESSEGTLARIISVNGEKYIDSITFEFGFPSKPTVLPPSPPSIVPEGSSQIVPIPSPSQAVFIRHRSSGKYLTIKGATKEDKKKDWAITILSDTIDASDPDSQKWIFRADGTIGSFISDKVLDIFRGKTEDGTAIMIYVEHKDKVAGWNQLWTLPADGSIKNPKTGKVMDVKDGKAFHGAEVVISSLPSTGLAVDSQKWEFVLATTTPLPIPPAQVVIF